MGAQAPGWFLWSLSGGCPGGSVGWSIDRAELQRTADFYNQSGGARYEVRPDDTPR